MVATGTENLLGKQCFQFGWMFPPKPEERDARLHQACEDAARSKRGIWGPTHSIDSQDTPVGSFYAFGTFRPNRVVPLLDRVESMQSVETQTSLPDATRQRPPVTLKVENNTQIQPAHEIHKDTKIDNVQDTQEESSAPVDCFSCPTTSLAGMKDEQNQPSKMIITELTLADSKDETQRHSNMRMCQTQQPQGLEDLRDSAEFGDSASTFSSFFTSKTMQDAFSIAMSNTGKDAELQAVHDPVSTAKEPEVIRNHRGMVVAVELQNAKAVSCNDHKPHMVLRHAKAQSIARATEAEQLSAQQPVEIVHEGFVQEETDSGLQQTAKVLIVPDFEASTKRFRTLSKDVDARSQKSFSTEQKEADISLATEEKEGEVSEGIIDDSDEASDDLVEMVLKHTIKKQDPIDSLQSISIFHCGEKIEYDIPSSFCLISKAEYDHLIRQEQLLLQMKSICVADEAVL